MGRERLHWHVAYIEFPFYTYITIGSTITVFLFVFDTTMEKWKLFWLTVIYKFSLMALIYSYSCLYGNVGGGETSVLVHKLYGTSFMAEWVHVKCNKNI